ncbi:Retrovirus-related Pol polyprotein from transposon 412 [Smittium mucronatum]|uniref:Retrovirus-related Pol polyprotein from transposon 412 n=1 Tax=Smittium mucronatum TaxID=133383 RepID=A0A1R0H4U1_9FUNG|nr:Retrovirus-related Pol polyprotein from transposon 412 [Smittium mucronatum]
MQMNAAKKKIKQVLCLPYHPKKNVKTERFNRTLKLTIKAYCTKDQSDWDEHLDMHILAYRTAKNEVLGLSPSEELYGHQPQVPANKLNSANPNISIKLLATRRNFKLK